MINKNYLVKKAEYESMNLTYTPFLNKMADLFKIDRSKMTFSKIGSLSETLSCDRHLGRSLPPELSNEDYENMRHLFYWKVLFEHG